MTPLPLYIDLETFSATPIKMGTYRYAADSEILLFAWALGDGPVHVEDATDSDFPSVELLEAIMEADEYVAHNSMFDRTVLRLSRNSNELLRAIGNDIPKWRDTMVCALAHALPASLDALSGVMGVEAGKRKQSGKKFIQLFCKPPGKNLKRGRATKLTHPAEWRGFIDYAGHDILAMRECWKKMPRWNYGADELALWHRDQRINDRGFLADTALAEAAVTAVERAQALLRDEVQEATDGDVQSATQRDALLAHILEAYGIALPNMQKDTLTRRIEDPDLPEPVRELLAIRLQASASSTSKYTALLQSVSDDSRLRGTLQFDGASRTRRWAGRRFQPQNMARPNLEAWEIATGIEAIMAGVEDLFTDNVMNLVSNAVRGCLIAPEGKQLTAVDLANIEGRMSAWVCGEAWKLAQFVLFDEGAPGDMYITSYGRSFNVDPLTIDKKTLGGYLKRQIGKVSELMLQYGGGVGAYITGAATYKIDLGELKDAAFASVPADVLKEATGFADWKNDQPGGLLGLDRDVFIACDALKRLWRRAHPAHELTWPALEAAAKDAIMSPGTWVDTGVFFRNDERIVVPLKVKFRKEGVWLRCLLPSGHSLCYPAARIGEDGQLSYMGMNQYSRKWQRLRAYGGKLLENIVQSLSRDVLAEGMIAIDDRSECDVVLTVHDEVIAETPDDGRDWTAICAGLLATVPSWCPGLPLAASGFSDYRYRKD